MAACTPCSSHTRRHASIAAGVVPQSSWSLNPDAPATSCSRSASTRTVLPLPKQRDVHRPRVECAQHHREVPRTRRDRRRPRAVGGTGAAADDRGDPRGQRLLQDLRADEVHVAVDAPGGQDHAVAGEDLGRGTDHQRGVDAVHRVGVARLADADDAPVAHADVGLHHTPVVEDHRTGDHEIGRALGARRRRLAHRLADHLAAAEHRFVAADAVIDLHLDEQVGVGQADAVARGRAVQPGVALTLDEHQPSTGSSAERRAARRRRRAGRRRRAARPSATRSTARSIPGSKRTDVPAGIASRHPRAATRSKSQRGIRLGEVVVRADLDRPIAGVDDLDGARSAGRRRSRPHPPPRAPLPARSCVVSFVRVRSSDRVVQGHELGAVGERRLDLHLGDHLRRRRPSRRRG